MSPFSHRKVVLGTHVEGQMAWEKRLPRGPWKPGLHSSVHQRPPWYWALDGSPHGQLPPHGAQQGLKATFPRRSCWSPARPQSAPFTNVPAHGPEHLRVRSEGNQAVSVTCQEVSHNQCLFIS